MYLRCWFNALAIRSLASVVSFDFHTGNVQYHQNLCLPFPLPATGIQSARRNKRAKKNRLGLAMKSIWCHVVFHSSRFSLVRCFFFCGGLVFAALQLHRENGKFSILRWCYDLCSQMHERFHCCNRHSIFFCFPSIFAYAKLKKTPKCVHNFPAPFVTYLSKNKSEPNKRGCELEHSPVANATKNRALNQSQRAKKRAARCIQCTGTKYK